MTDGPTFDRPPDEPTLVRHEEELDVRKSREQIGFVGARKVVETEHVADVVAREIEDADVERTVPNEQDSGQIETLPDGSVSIPILEEELVVSKRTVVRERIVIRKRTVSEEHRVEADLRRERLEVESFGDVEVIDERVDGHEPVTAETAS